MDKNRKISGLFTDFKKIEHVAFGNQIEFVDSLYRQFAANGSLSEKQVAALGNIVAQCEGYLSESVSWPACVPH